MRFLSSLLLSAAAADYISTNVYLDSSCNGPAYSTNAYYIGCTAMSATASMKVVCSNSTFGSLYYYLTSNTCSGASTLATSIPLTGPTCLPGGNGTFTQQVCSTGNYSSPSGSYAMTTSYADRSTPCQGSVLTLSTTTVGTCFRNTAANQSAIATCNSSGVTQTLYGGAGCSGAAVMTTFTPLGCNASANSVVSCNAVTAASPSATPAAAGNATVSPTATISTSSSPSPVALGGNVTRSATASIAPTGSASPSGLGANVTRSGTPSNTASGAPTTSASGTVTATGSVTGTPLPSVTASSSVEPTPRATKTRMPSHSHSRTKKPSMSRTKARSHTRTKTAKPKSKSHTRKRKLME